MEWRKESSLACYRAMTKGGQVVCLVNMLSEDGIYSRSHGIGSELLRLQAEAIGIPIIQRKTTWESYEKEFKNTILQLKKKILRQAYLEILIFRSTETGLRGYAERQE